MGRPPIGNRAMTAAERQRRHRARLRGSKPKIAQVKHRQYVATLFDLLSAYAQKRLAALQAENAALKDEIFALKRKRAQRGKEPRALKGRK
jgi:hypothetical protein